MKKLLSLVLAMVMLMACAAPALADEGSEPDWTEYDALVAESPPPTLWSAKRCCTRPRIC